MTGATYLANFLQDRDYHFEVANMEGWQGQLNMTKVSIALLQRLPAGFAQYTLATCTLCAYSSVSSGKGPAGRSDLSHQSPVQRSIQQRSSLIVEVVELTGRNLNHSLIDNVLVGAAGRQVLEATWKVEDECHIQDPKVNLLDALWNTLQHLFLDGDARGSHRLHLGQCYRRSNMGTVCGQRDVGTAMFEKTMPAKCSLDRSSAVAGALRKYPDSTLLAFESSARIPWFDDEGAFGCQKFCSRPSRIGCMVGHEWRQDPQIQSHRAGTNVSLSSVKQMCRLLKLRFFSRYE